MTLPQKVYDAFLRSASEYNSSTLAKDARERGRYEPRFTESGLYAGIDFTFTLDFERIWRTFQRIAQGLYFAVHQQALPRESQIELLYTPRSMIQDQERLLVTLGAHGPYTLGGTACAILFGSEHTDEHIVSRSFLMFYNKSVAIDVMSGARVHLGEALR